MRPDDGHGSDGLFAARRGAGLVAQVLDGLPEQVQHLGIIVHHEDTAVARHGYRRR